MADLSDRQAAIDALWKALFEYEDKTEKQFLESDELDISDWMIHRIFVQNMSDIDRETILNLPSAQPEYDLDGYSSRLWKAAYERGKQDAEQERKTGRWVATPNGFHYCSNCRMGADYDNYGHEVLRDFCPNCGAKMVEDDPSHPFADDVMMGKG